MTTVMTPKQKSQQVAQNLGLLAKNHKVSGQQIEAFLKSEKEKDPSVKDLKNQNIYRVFQGFFPPTLETVFLILTAINQITGQSYSLKDIDLTNERSFID